MSTLLWLPISRKCLLPWKNTLKAPKQLLNQLSNNLKNITQPCPVCGETGKFSFTGKDLLMGLAGEFDYATCNTCQTIYQSPTPSPETIASFYPDEYEPYQPGQLKKHNPLRKAVLRTTYGYRHISGGLPDWIGQLAGNIAYRDSIPYKPEGRLLDIGCGSGKYLLSMQQLGWQVEGVEFNPTAAQTCKEAGLEVFSGELSEAAFSDNRFDVITARHVIEHIATPKSFVSEISRILKPGGIMILMTPNSQALGRGWFGTNWYANDAPRHLILFAPDNLQRLATQEGFQKVSVRTSSSPKIFLNSWDYLTQNRGKPSKRRRIRRFFARGYVLAAALCQSGDEIISVFKKN